MGWTFQGLNPGRDKRLLLLPVCPKQFWGPSILHFSGYWILPWGGMDGGVKLTVWLCVMLLCAFMAEAGMDCFDGILFSTYL